jgi:hypothetical protein
VRKFGAFKGDIDHRSTHGEDLAARLGGLRHRGDRIYVMTTLRQYGFGPAFLAHKLLRYCSNGKFHRGCGAITLI